jgi:electron transfer flavoprotein beta subunit
MMVAPTAGEQSLGIPVVTCVNKMSIDRDVTRCERKLGDRFEVVQASLPGLVTVLPDLNVPRIPRLKQILTVSKKPVQDVTVETWVLSLS